MRTRDQQKRGQLGIFGGTTYVNPGQPAVAEGGDRIAEKGDAQKQEESLIGLAGNDEVLVGSENIDTANQEGCGGEVHREGDGDIANNVKPTTDPSGDAAPLRRG